MIKRFNEQPSERVLNDELRALWTEPDARPGPPADAMKLRARRNLELAHPADGGDAIGFDQPYRIAAACWRSRR
jgi:hypothetical protein